MFPTYAGLLYLLPLPSLLSLPSILQNNSFDVNSEKNSNGDLLVHVAVRQGLVSLPLMFVLVHMYKANIDARNTKGHTPLCLAAQLGDENMIEVWGPVEMGSGDQ